MKEERWMQTLKAPLDRQVIKRLALPVGQCQEFCKSQNEDWLWKKLFIFRVTFLTFFRQLNKWTNNAYWHCYRSPPVLLFWTENFLKSQKEKNRKVAHFFLFFLNLAKCLQKISVVYKICRPHPHPASPTLHLLRPESACLLTSNPPLLMNTFDIHICNCACDCIWICICQNCDEKNTTRISVRTYTFAGPGLTQQADYSPGTLHRRRPPPLTVSGHDHLHFTKTRLLFKKDGTWGSLALASQLWPL